MKTKTNAMRLLDRANIPYEVAEYEVDESDLSGVHLAETLGIDVERVFKTLVTRGDKNGLHVFVIPAAEELDLKKCAAVTGDKRIAGVTFTGSTDVGVKIAENCGKNLKYQSLEMGGNAPLIVNNDVELDYAVNESMAGRATYLTGQICSVATVC